MRFFLSFVLFSSAFASQHQVISGTVDVQFEGQRWDITAETDRSILHWDEFSIPADHAMHFHLPAETSALLNRVHGDLPSHIQGALHSNGAVYLVNPNGIIIGPNSCINVASLVATTLDFSNEDFLQGNDLPFQGSSLASIENSGKLVAQNGDVILFAHRIVNKGTIEAENALLGTGHEILLCLEGTKHFYIKPSSEVADLLLNEGTISASNIALQATSRPSTFAIQNKGRIDATTVVQENGKVYLRAKGGFLENKGAITASEVVVETEEAIFYNHKTIEGKEISLNVGKTYNFGTISANGEERGGRISIDASHFYIETQRAKLLAEGKEEGGRISIQTNNYFTSGTTSVNGAFAGKIFINADRLVVAAGHLSASGADQGGKITLRSYSETHPISINPHSTIQVHSEKAPGAMELQTLLEPKGTLLLENGLQATGACIGDALEFEAPASASSLFGFAVIALDTGNVVITDPTDSAGGASAGAVHLYNGATAALISTVTGSAGDLIGVDGANNTVFSIGDNYVIGSPLWDNGGSSNAGAATWVNGETGELADGSLGGAVSIDNSLIGATASDNVGTAVLALSNGNYVVHSLNWNNPSGPVSQVGAATWGNGATGITGTVSIANSLIGSTASDNIGTNALALTNGNYVVGSFNWDIPGGAANVGAATWGNGTIGVTGTVSIANSLIGTTAVDHVGDNFTSGATYTGFVALTNGNYTVASTAWNDPSGPTTDVGAVTWGNGSTGVTGTVSVANSLIGTTAFDFLGGEIEVAALSNGNYVVPSRFWNGGRGAATWGNGTIGVTGTVSIANSLIGTTADDNIGNGGITALTNNNYVVRSSDWNNPSGPASIAGAATWGNGSTGITGTVSIANSLIGTSASDQVSSDGVTALTNGNYVVATRLWNNPSGPVSDAGAATWGNGSTGITGTVSIVNSLIGTSASDQIGGEGATALTNGNYVVGSPRWNDPSGNSAVGAATWVNGATGITGTVSIANSLVGTQLNDLVSETSIIALTTGHYVVLSHPWNNGGTSGAGAVTWGDGTKGITGTVSIANSLVGSHTGDSVPTQSTALLSGNYIVISNAWDSSTGSVTLGDGGVGTYCDAYGTISAENSFLGANVNSGLSPFFQQDSVNETFIVQFSNYNGADAIFAFAQGEPTPPPPPSPSPSSSAAAETPPAKGRVDYNIAISEAFQQWTTTFLRGMVEDNVAPPRNIHKQFSLPLRSLVRDLEKETP